MISDSPYDAQDLAVRPRIGFLAGAVASGVSLALVAALEDVSHLSFEGLLSDLAKFFLPSSLSDGSGEMPGAVLYVIVGALLGGLYAASQQRIPPRGLLLVGTFYGVFLWFAAGRILGWLFGHRLESRFRSWGWLAACVAYALCLAVVAIVSESRRPSEAARVPLD